MHIYLWSTVLSSHMKILLGVSENVSGTEAFRSHIKVENTSVHDSAVM